jgi:MFS family permease
MLSVLRQRSFALLWIGGLLSVTGDWVLNTALPFFVYRRTGSTIATAGMVAAELGPSVLVGSFAGVYVDRLDRRRLLVATNVGQAAAVACLLGIAHGAGLWVVYAVAAAQSVLASFSQPAEAAVLPSIVGPGDLLAANALATLNRRLARLAGVPLGGLLLGLVGLDAVVLLDAASFLAAAAMTAAAAVPRLPRETESAAFVREWVDGLRLVRRDPAIGVLFGVLGLMTFGGTMIDPLYVAWVRDVLHGSAQVYAFLLAAHSAAGIAGTVLVGHRRLRLPPRVLMGWSSVVAGCMLIAKFDLPVLAVAFALSVLGGAVSVASAIGVETLLQTIVRAEFRGRVFAALGASGSLFSLAGAVVGGVAARVVGVTAMLNVSAGLVILSGLVVLQAIRPTPARLPAHPRGGSDVRHHP